MILDEEIGIPDDFPILIKIINKIYLNYPKNEMLKNDNGNIEFILLINKDDILKHLTDIGLKDKIKKFFFNGLNIHIIKTNNNGTSKYIANKVKWDSVNNILDIIYIKITLNIGDDDFITSLNHELLHAYQDYQTRLKTNNQSLEYNQKHYSTSTPEQLEISKNFSKDSPLDICEKFIYFLLKNERGANVSELYHEMERQNITREKINNGEYKKLKEFQNYTTIYENSDKLINNLDLNELNILKRFIRETSISRLISENDEVFKKRLINYFKDSSQKTLNKFYRLMSKYLDDNEKKQNEKYNTPSTLKIIEMINKTEKKY